MEILSILASLFLLTSKPDRFGKQDLQFAGLTQDHE